MKEFTLKYRCNPYKKPATILSKSGSDALFPFSDNIDRAAQSGVKFIAVLFACFNNIAFRI